MRILILIFFLIVSMSADEVKNKKTNKVLENTHLKSFHTKQLSKQEQAYQNHLKEKEEENRKLEEDGFYSCNND